MPQKSKDILDRIRVKPDFSARGFSAADYGTDLDYGYVEKDKKFLFPPLLIED